MDNLNLYAEIQRMIAVRDFSPTQSNPIIKPSLLSKTNDPMSRRKKSFPCGHKGYGQICHRCAQQQAVWVEKKQKKNAWEAAFAKDPIDLRTLPKNVVIKAREIISGLDGHKNYRDFHGKRLRHDRFIISIPVTRNYRLICRDHGAFVSPEAVISHEDYNVCKPGG